MKPENCSSCRSWNQTTPPNPDAPATVRGVCRRFPPMPPDGRFPNTFATTRCDEWREKPEPEPAKTAVPVPNSALAVEGEVAKVAIEGPSRDEIGWASREARRIAVAMGGHPTHPEQNQIRAEIEIGKALLAAYNGGWRDRGNDDRTLPEPGEHR